MAPLAYSKPAGRRIVATKLLPIGRNCCACQPISPALRIACEVNLPVEALRKTLAFELASERTWESTVGEVTSYEAAATISARESSRTNSALKLRRYSLP